MGYFIQKTIRNTGTDSLYPKEFFKFLKLCPFSILVIHQISFLLPLILADLYDNKYFKLFSIIPLALCLITKNKWLSVGLLLYILSLVGSTNDTLTPLAQNEYYFRATVLSPCHRENQ